MEPYGTLGSLLNHLYCYLGIFGNKNIEKRYIQLLFWYIWQQEPYKTLRFSFLYIWQQKRKTLGFIVSFCMFRTLWPSGQGQVHEAEGPGPEGAKNAKNAKISIQKLISYGVQNTRI